MRYTHRALRRFAAVALALALTFAGAWQTAPLSTGAASLSELQKQLNALQSEEKSLRGKLQNYQNDMAKQQEYADSLQEKIKNSQQQIDLLQQQIDLLENEMEEKSSAIDQRSADIEACYADIDARIATFGDRLRVISQTGNLTNLQMFLNTDDYVDYLLKSKVVERIAQNDQRMIDQLNDEISALNAEKDDLQAQREQIDAQRQEVAAIKATADEKKAELDSLYAESAAVMKSLQASVDSVNSELEKKKKEEEALDKQIQKLIENSRQSSSAHTGHYSAGSMYWPVPAVHNISSGFGYRWGRLHRGIDISNGAVKIYGQNIVAAADGTVIYANTSGWGGGYGLFVMVDHGTDSAGRQIVTLYAHMSAVLVSVGQKVTGGSTVLGRAGSTGDSTGPHLHFEVRVNGTAVDPFSNGYLTS